MRRALVALLAVTMMIALAMALLPLAVLSFNDPSVPSETMEDQIAPGASPHTDQAIMPILFRSLLAGLSTSLGAAVVLLMRGRPSPAQMSFSLALAGGVMVTVSFVELWLPQLARPEQWLFSLVTACSGGLAFVALSRLLPEPEYTGHLKSDEAADKCDDVEAGGGSDSDHKKGQWRLAVLMMVALTAHNFPEGLAVAVSSLQSSEAGFVVMIAIAVHNIPEGIAIAMPVLDATGSPMRAMQMATLSGLAEPLGALVALVMLPQGVLEGRGMDALLSAVGGIMTCVALLELFPEAYAQGRPLYMFLGTLAGFLVMMLTHELA